MQNDRNATNGFLWIAQNVNGREAMNHRTDKHILGEERNMFCCFLLLIIQWLTNIKDILSLNVFDIELFRENYKYIQEITYNFAKAILFTEQIGKTQKNVRLIASLQRNSRASKNIQQKHSKRFRSLPGYRGQNESNGSDVWLCLVCRVNVCVLCVEGGGGVIFGSGGLIWCSEMRTGHVAVVVCAAIRRAGRLVRAICDGHWVLMLERWRWWWWLVVEMRGESEGRERERRVLRIRGWDKKNNWWRWMVFDDYYQVKQFYNLYRMWADVLSWEQTALNI